MIDRPHGIVLVTGPTGSGKSTTLYSALNEIKEETTKIITVEDPVEYQQDGHQPDSDSSEDRPDVRRVLAQHLASRPGRDPDRRNARSRDGGERRSRRR